MEYEKQFHTLSHSISIFHILINMIHLLLFSQRDIIRSERRKYHAINSETTKKIVISLFISQNWECSVHISALKYQ